MKNIQITLLVCLLSCLTVAQSKTKTPVTLEIDELAKSYNGINSITLYTSNGELYGNVLVTYNINNKPESVQVSSESTNKDAVVEFLTKIIQQKIDQGFSEISNEYYGAEYLSEKFQYYPNLNFTFIKGSRYFLCKCGRKEAQYFYDMSGKKCVLEESQCWFTIETGDNSRKGGSKSTDFKF